MSNMIPYWASGSPCAPAQQKIVGVLSVDCTLTPEGLIWIVASACQGSTDPYMQGIISYAHQHRMRLATPSNLHAVAGGELRAMVDGRDVRLSARSTLQQNVTDLNDVQGQARLLEAIGCSILYVTVDNLLVGGIVFGNDGHDSTQPASVASRICTGDGRPGV